MRVLTISDKVVDSLYSSALTQIAQGVELVLSCGDLPREYLEYIVTLLNVPLYYVFGNHDGDGKEPPIIEGAENLDLRTVEYKGLVFAGLGGSLRYNDRPLFQYSEIEMRARIARISPALLLNRARTGRYLDVLMTHAPPLGIQDGADLPHRGFDSFVWFIEHYQPAYLIHGHVHILDNRKGWMTRHGQTDVVNTYGYRLLDIPTKVDSEPLSKQLGDGT